MAHIKIYIVTTLYQYRDLEGNYRVGSLDLSTPYLFTNQKKAKGFISRIIERWKNEGFDSVREPTDVNEKLSNFRKCFWECKNIAADEKRVIIFDPTLTE